MTPGLSTTIQASLASPPGDDAGWFWAYECVDTCSHAILGADVAVAFGSRGLGGRMLSVGGGIDGLRPYAEVFHQLPVARPVGIGARLSIAGRSNWKTYQLYMRSDFRLDDETRFLWNPGLFVHRGNSPNGENPGSFIGLVNGFGFASGSGPVTVTPSASVIWGRTQRKTYGEQIGPSQTVFVTGAISIGFREDRRDRTSPP